MAEYGGVCAVTQPLKGLLYSGTFGIAKAMP